MSNMIAEQSIFKEASLKRNMHEAIFITVANRIQLA
jgi:hypothetical protein